MAPSARAVSEGEDCRGWQSCLMGDAGEKAGSAALELDVEAGLDDCTSCSGAEAVESLLWQLAPSWSSLPESPAKLREERFRNLLDLARLDKEDLRELGLSMAERGRVLHWARRALEPQGVEPLMAGTVVSEMSDASPEHKHLLAFTSPKHASKANSLDSAALSHSFSALATCPVKRYDALQADFNAGPAATPKKKSSEEERLDEIESQADFWCNCFTVAADAVVPNPMDAALQDVRENILEAFFDCTPERVREVISSIGQNSQEGAAPVSFGELQLGLERCGLAGLDPKTLSNVFERVMGDKCALQAQQVFDTVLTRLRLAQLLLKPLKDASLMVVDYNYSSKNTSSKAVVNFVDEGMMRDFCFGHRPVPKSSEEGTAIRWVHMPKFNLTLLLALTVKYCLHPLSVEDVIEQQPTKIDRYGQNFFLSVELLSVAKGPGVAGSAAGPVRVQGQHVVAFCAGPPRLDTLLTVIQPERNFAKDWPGGSSSSSSRGGEPSRWPERLRQRLEAARSRLTERKADFLLYTVVDLCADELVDVTHAYLARLASLEDDLRTHGERSLLDLGEVSLARLQLAVVARRLKSLQRVVRRASDLEDLHTTGSSDYWKDCAEHLEEAYDDAMHLAERCDALKASHEQAMERGHAERQRLQQELSNAQAERMNRMLFVLTLATTLFTPLQFMSSVYGMNFVDKEGQPTIPELLQKDGYRLFWIVAGSYMLVAGIAVCCLRRRLLKKSTV
eukprot:TRINITY_DN7516_c0_g1_i3.p1 TRINITY_DN7516_c0_g1~~TRINITY_DN7516_c0_g1_i3.p1  ORF type:complete len:736 (-),score=155.74 TRINITY_DN7516_c0_g1_i3:19-2226(-)